MTARLRVGLAGLGTMGRNHLRLLATRDDTRLSAVADPDPGALASAAAATSAAAFADPLAMVEEAPIDALVIAAPTTAHRPLADAAIARGLPVLVEKPIAATVEEALSLVEAADRRGVPIQVGHVERFNPAVIELGRRLGEGWIGRLYSITSRRAGPYPARIRDVGVTIDLATHDADILCWVSGERPTRVFGEVARRVDADHEDLLFGLLHFPSGATGMLDVNWLTPAKRRQLTVVGEAGMFELDYLTQHLTFTRADVERRRLIRGYATTFEGDVAEIDVEPHEPLAAELDDFVAVARGGGRPIVDGMDGTWALSIASSLLAAADRGSPVAIGPLPSLAGAR